MSKPILSYDRLRELLHYDPETGVFTRLTKTGSRWLAGQIATPTMDSNGYAQLFVAGKKRAAHRLAWLYVYGTYPLGQVDHINGIQTDNRIANLRDTTPSENCQNKHGARSDSTDPNESCLVTSPRLTLHMLRT